MASVLSDRFFAPDNRADLRTRALLYGGWLAAALFLVLHHVMWRDEVRALSLALRAPTLVGMFGTIQGEGHPALWYLVLRGAHALAPTPLVLPAVAFGIGAATAALWTFRAPFRPLTIALVLFGGFMLFEYTVMARNYGISALLILAVADRYRTQRDRGVTLGVLLALLCSTNAPSVLIAGGIMLFWLAEIVGEHGVRWTAALRRFAINAAIAGAGVVACLLVIYPPVNDAAVGAPPHGWGWLVASLNVAGGFWSLVPLAVWAVPGGFVAILAVALAPFSLVRRPAALLAALAVMLATMLFFQAVYPGSYRHAALFPVFLLALHWMVAGLPDRPAARWLGAGTTARLYGAGGAAFALLLALQILPSAAAVADTLRGLPASQARSLGRLLHRPDLRDAVVMANPDVMLETLPFYAPNRIYFVRDRRYGDVTRLTRHVRRDLTYADLLRTARRLQAATGRPIVIATMFPPDPAAPPRIRPDGYVTTFTARPADARAFLAATRRLADPEPAGTDESYAVHLLPLPVRR